MNAKTFGDVLDTSRELFSVRQSLAKTGSFNFGHPSTSPNTGSVAGKRLTGYKTSQMSGSGSPRHSEAGSQSNTRLRISTTSKASVPALRLPTVKGTPTNQSKMFGSKMSSGPVRPDEDSDYEDDGFDGDG